ncbi:MAG: tellurite resistance TerB C-terminal domain-containing protein [Bacteroidota bacterium]
MMIGKRKKIDCRNRIRFYIKSPVLKVCLLLILQVFSLNTFAQDLHLTTADLNLRNGPGTNYKSIAVILKGDTVELIESSGGIWVKIKYKNDIGYSSKKYLQKIELKKEKIEADNSNYGFLLFVIGLLLIILTSKLLTRAGENHRNKIITMILSLFFGALGFQKFYLGKKKSGWYSVVFSWTFIPLVLGILEFMDFALTRQEKFNEIYNRGKELKKKTKKKNPILKSKKQSTLKTNDKGEISSYRSKQKAVDESIIDVNTQNLDLSIERNTEEISSFEHPPYWEHVYVFSSDTINIATTEQKQYYKYFKDSVAKGEFLDIQGNTNYAFILYFDFLNEYQNHKDIQLLDKQFKLLGEICPKTLSYSLNSLKNELRKRNDSYSFDKLKNLEDANYLLENGYKAYNPDLYKLGNKYKDKLDLNKQEINWLNKFYDPSNVFTSIEGCSISVIKIYLAVFKELNFQLLDINSDLDSELDIIFEKVCELESLTFGEYDTEYERRWAIAKFHESFYITFYKTIENMVREEFGHKRKLSFERYYPYSKSTSYIDETIGNSISEIIVDKLKSLDEPDFETQIELNTQNVNRWKIQFEILKNGFKVAEKDKFLDVINTIEELNQKNPNIENIFFEASKFIAKYDNVQALKYYAKYIYYDLKSARFDNRELTKTVQKSLFKTEEQINEFKKIIADLIETRDIQKALEKISKFYIPKRKRIQLDRSIIQEVEQKHEGTVELLNEYLIDEEDKSEMDDNNGEDIQVEVIPSQEYDSKFISELSMDKVQADFVEMIVSNSFQINQNDADKYATENGMFKNQLIDSINEACEEYLDGEALIEEDEESYLIEESYYKEITK